MDMRDEKNMCIRRIEQPGYEGNDQVSVVTGQGKAIAGGGRLITQQSTDVQADKWPFAAFENCVPQIRLQSVGLPRSQPECEVNTQTMPLLVKAMTEDQP